MISLIILGFDPSIFFAASQILSSEKSLRNF